MLARILGYHKLPTKNTSATLNVSKTSFKKAIVDDNLEVAYNLLQNHFDELKLSTRELNNALHLVSGTTHPMGPTIVTELLLPGRADPNARRSGDGDTPLCLASYVGNLDIVRELLGAQANPNIGMNDSDTPLMMASNEGHVEIVELLLTHGADINLKNSDGYTALDYANEKVRPILKRRLSAAAKWALAHNECQPLLKKGGRRTRRKARR
jgi:ankyrin repeat protein